MTDKQKDDLRFSLVLAGAEYGFNDEDEPVVRIHFAQTDLTREQFQRLSDKADNNYRIEVQLNE